MRGSLLRSLRSVPLLGIACLAVVALAPGVAPIFGSAEGAESVFDRPAAPLASAAQSRVTTPEDVVLANWEYTAKNPFGDAFRDVLQALEQVNNSNEDAAGALGAKSSKQALNQDKHAAEHVYRAFLQLADAAKDAKSFVLAADASAMLNIYIQMQHALGNPTAIFSLSQQAQALGNKAVTDATPFK